MAGAASAETSWIKSRYRSKKVDPIGFPFPAGRGQRRQRFPTRRSLKGNIHTATMVRRPGSSPLLAVSRNISGNLRGGGKISDGWNAVERSRGPRRPLAQLADNAPACVEDPCLRFSRGASFTSEPKESNE